MMTTTTRRLIIALSLGAVALVSWQLALAVLVLGGGLALLVGHLEGREQSRRDSEGIAQAIARHEADEAEQERKTV